MSAELGGGMQPQPETKKSKRRNQLLAFQREIVKRTQDARDNVDNQSRRLAVQAGSEHVLIDLKQTGELLTNINLTSVPLTKSWFLGLTNNRGNLIGVVDLAGFLGKPITASEKSDRLLVFASTISTHCAIRVSKVFGLIDVTTMSPEPLVQRSLRHCTQIYIDQESKKWMQIDLASMAHDPAFLDIRQ